MMTEREHIEDANTDDVLRLARAMDMLDLPSVQYGEPRCQFCAWEPEHGAHDDDCAFTLAANMLGRRRPWHDVDGRRCH
jgi:hypothetical protein